MKQPLLYEINTRCWLNELSETSGATIDLGNIPETEFTRWRQWEFTHIWLMGVWTTGPRSRAAALNSPELSREFREAWPDFQPDDVAGSPFAIADYEVPSALGGEAGLKQFRKRLHACGLKLLLDFVPNHLGLDHAWVAERPELFIQSSAQKPETFPQETRVGTRWLAHGKDPYFPAWIDTAQLDYRRSDTRLAMIGLLQAVARLCDGVRCDMAMLVLKEVFAKTWQSFPYPLTPPTTEFWDEAIQAVRKSRPDFLFLAEVYWDLETQLQSLGFDYTYDKRLYDHLIARQPREAQAHLLHQAKEFCAASVHFLENHDEPRIASLLSPAEHRAAALAVLGLPGLRFLHEGELSGARTRLPVHLRGRPKEPHQEEIAALYEKLLTVLPATAVGSAEGELLEPRVAWDDNSTAQNFILVEWQSARPELDLVVVNLASHHSQCYAPLTIPGLDQHNWQMKDLLGAEIYLRRGDDLQIQGLYLDVPGQGAQLFHFQPVN